MSTKSDWALAQAPLRGFRWTGSEPSIISVSDDVRLVRSPEFILSDSLRSRLGTVAVREIEEARWAIEYRYDADPQAHVGPKEKLAHQIMYRTLLAMWITRPSGARFAYVVVTHHRHGDEAHTVNRFESFMPHEGWISNTFDDSLLSVLNEVFQGVTDVLEKRLRQRIALGALAAALPSSNWDTRLIGLTTALECFLSPGDRDTRRRLAQRAAVFLHPAGEQRDSVYADIGTIYDARSTLVHGSELQIESDHSKCLLMRLESIVQGVAKKALSDPELVSIFAGSQTHGNYFTKALEGARFVDPP